MASLLRYASQLKLISFPMAAVSTESRVASKTESHHRDTETQSRSLDKIQMRDSPQRHGDTEKSPRLSSRRLLSAEGSCVCFCWQLTTGCWQLLSVPLCDSVSQPALPGSPASAAFAVAGVDSAESNGW
jgi:hypothetical protein